MASLKMLLMFFLIIASTVLGACSKTNNPTSSSGVRNPLSAPALNTTSTAALARRSFSADNFVESCVFLNDSFKKMNTASICVQSDLSLTGEQVTDQKAEFRRLGPDSSVSSFSLNNTAALGNSIKADDLRAGDLFYLKKTNSHSTYEMTIEILSVGSDSITLNYQVKSFSLIY